MLIETNCDFIWSAQLHLLLSKEILPWFVDAHLLLAETESFVAFNLLW